MFFIGILKSIGEWLLARLFGGTAAIEAQKEKDNAESTVAAAKEHAASTQAAADTEVAILQDQQKIKDHYDQQAAQPQSKTDPFGIDEWNKDADGKGVKK